MDSETVENDK